MSIRNTQTSYGSVAKFFHWVISPLVILMLTIGYFLEDVPKDYQGMAYNLHKLTGLLILFLVLLRLVWALFNPKPALPRDMPAWQQFMSKLLHYALYFFVILMPSLGWVGSIAGGHPPHIGDFKFELPIAPNKALDEFAFHWHETIAIVLIVLISLHVLAALYHHLIRKDDVLKRMLP